MPTPLEVFSQVTKGGASGSESRELTLVSGSVPPELPEPVHPGFHGIQVPG